MFEFTPLTVATIDKSSSDSVVITFDTPPGDAFTYRQGQYLTLRKEFDGEEIRRSYSICASARDNKLRIGIRCIADGWFSSWANNELSVGDVIEALPPVGRFTASIDEGQNYCAFAAGSGITPILSNIKTTLEENSSARVTLFYSNRSMSSIMFREELNDLKDRYLDRFELFHIFTRGEGDTELFSGRIDMKKCKALFETFPYLRIYDQFLICGPRAATKTITDFLQAEGITKDKIKFELFASPPSKKRKMTSEAAITDKSVEVSVTLDGVTHQFAMPTQGQSVLEAALEHHIEMPYSCQAGVCSTCTCKILEGEVDMENNFSLEDYEVEEGYVLACQSYPKSNKVKITSD